MADNYLSKPKDYEVDVPQGGGEPVQVGMLPNSQSPIYTIPGSTIAVLDHNDNPISGNLIFYNDRDQDGNAIVRYGIADPQSQQVYHITDDDVTRQISQRVATSGQMSGRLVNRVTPVESQMNQLSVEIPYYKSPGEVDPEYGDAGWDQLSPDQLAAMADMTAARFARTLNERLASQPYSPVFRERVMQDAERQIADVRQKAYAWYQYQQLIAQISREKSATGAITPQTAERVKEFAKTVGMDPSKIIHASQMETQSSGTVDGDKSFFLPEKTWTGTYAYGGGGVVLPQYASPIRDAVDLAAAQGSETREALARRTADSGWGMLALPPVAYSDYRNPAVLPLYMPKVQGPSYQSQVSVQEEPSRVGGGGGGGGGGTRREINPQTDFTLKVRAYNQTNPYVSFRMRSGEFANPGANASGAYAAFAATVWNFDGGKPGGRISPDVLEYITKDPASVQDKSVEEVFKDALENGKHTAFIQNTLKQMGGLSYDEIIKSIQVGYHEGATELFATSLAALQESALTAIKWIRQLANSKKRPIVTNDDVDLLKLWDSSTEFREAVKARFGSGADPNVVYNWVRAASAAFKLMKEMGGRNNLQDPTRIGAAAAAGQSNVLQAMSNYLNNLNLLMTSSRTSDGRIWDMSKFKGDADIFYTIKTGVNAFANAALSTAGSYLESATMSTNSYLDAKEVGKRIINRGRQLGKQQFPFNPQYTANGMTVRDSRIIDRTNAVTGTAAALTGIEAVTRPTTQAVEENSRRIAQTIAQQLQQQKQAIEQLKQDSANQGGGIRVP